MRVVTLSAAILCLWMSQKYWQYSRKTFSLLWWPPQSISNMAENRIWRITTDFQFQIQSPLLQWLESRNKEKAGVDSLQASRILGCSSCSTIILVNKSTSHWDILFNTQKEREHVCSNMDWARRSYNGRTTFKLLSTNCVKERKLPHIQLRTICTQDPDLQELRRAENVIQKQVNFLTPRTKCLFL